MFGGASVSGMMAGEKEKSRTKGNSSTSFWNKQQKSLAKPFFSDYLKPRVGEGLPTYQGELPGTSGPGAIESSLFSDAQAGTGAFSSWARLAGPDEWNKRVAERAATEQGLLAPERAKEDAALKQRMASMGLSSSSDVVKSEMDLGNKRELQDKQFRQGLYDSYEKMGLEVTPQVIETMSKVGETQRQIEEAGLTAKFTEWLRTQPEYSPVIDQILAALGLKAAESTQGKEKFSGDTFGWAVSGTGSAGF